MTLTLTIFIKIRVSSSTRVDILWDGTGVSLSFDNFLIIIDHQSKTPEQLYSMIDYENPIIEQHYRPLTFTLELLQLKNIIDHEICSR